MTTCKCPYDDTYCELKAQELERFRARVRSMAKNKINQVVIQPADDECPTEPAACLRYQRYLNIVNKIKANEIYTDGR